ncbi:MAG: hypothetical protein CMG76_00185 [Candidatus Marinimicrobia bacterium]|nr:hypothetical protein [Candidatus Neomarinimicrobiota bacterium]
MSMFKNKKLKAIMFTDIVNFTKLSATDEESALDIIDKQRELLQPIVNEYKGQWLKEIGDGILISFDSSIDAVRCSIKIQEILKNVEEFKLRIGIHQGDIFIKDGDIFGDDVNIASRVEGFAPEGGVSISDKVYRDIQGVKDINTSFIGHKPLKGVSQETKVRCITSNNLPKPSISIFSRIIPPVCFVIGISILIFWLIFINRYINGTMFVMQPPSDIEFMINWFNSFTLLFLLGYSTLSYSKGISVKSQKALYYFSIFYVSNWVVVLSYVISIEIFYPNWTGTGPLWAILQIIIIPTLIYLLFKFIFKKLYY